MKKLVLAAAAVLALGTGTAFAGADDYAQTTQTTQSARASGDRLAFATSTRSQVSIYSTFRGDGYAQGGDR